MLEVKKGDKLALVGFTGIRLADVEVSGVSKTQLKIVKKDGAELIFDRKTGIQTNLPEGKEKYANKVMALKDAPVNKPKSKEKPAAKPKKEAKVKVEVEPEEAFDDDEEDGDFDDDDDEFEEV